MFGVACLTLQRRVVRFGPKVGQISQLAPHGTNPRLFFRSNFSIFWLIKNVLKSDLKKSRICPIWDQFDPLSVQIYHPDSLRYRTVRLIYLNQGMHFCLTSGQRETRSCLSMTAQGGETSLTSGGETLFTQRQLRLEEWHYRCGVHKL